MKRIVGLLVTILVGTTAVLYLYTGSFDFISTIKNFSKSPEKKEIIEENLSEVVAAIKKEISNPTPLRARDNSARAHLTHDGVVTWTNIQRKNEAGLPPLASDPLLDRIAEARLKDMFAKQYFEHYSPTGEGASDIADQVGYDYITIGENIALGNFENDQVIVQAWMDSPGHRANILNTRYTEIGIAVATGTFEGRRTWIGVQIFAKPNTCPVVNKALKNSIDESTQTLNLGKARIRAISEELSAMQINNEQQRQAYNAKVEEYNELARRLNQLSASIKEMVSTYNAQVNAFNTCIQS